MFIQLKNHKVHVYSQSEIDHNKKSILFIPGAGMDHRILSMFKMDSFTNYYNVLAIDLPGHGYTTGPLLYDVESHTEVVKMVLDQLKLNHLILSGHSWGGLVALDLSTQCENDMTLCMNIAYPFLVGDILLDYAKGNLDQAVEFLMKYGIYKMPETEIKTTGFGVKGSGFYGRSKGEIKSPYGTKTVENDPEREIKLYPLKRLFNQTEKEISSIDLKSCTSFRLKNGQIKQLRNVKYLFCDKDKLARYNPENELFANADHEKDIFMLEETGHFPYFEDPDQLEMVFKKIFG
tara:strand:+ start:545 stop:1417 length:873 start_codon:yes stop_codon:yes gene_type:complete